MICYEMSSVNQDRDFLFFGTFSNQYEDMIKC